jgi:hypothetical protein
VAHASAVGGAGPWSSSQPRTRTMGAGRPGGRGRRRAARAGSIVWAEQTKWRAEEGSKGERGRVVPLLGKTHTLTHSHFNLTSTRTHAGHTYGRSLAGAPWSVFPALKRKSVAAAAAPASPGLRGPAVSLSAGRKSVRINTPAERAPHPGRVRLHSPLVCTIAHQLRGRGCCVGLLKARPPAAGKDENPPCRGFCAARSSAAAPFPHGRGEGADPGASRPRSVTVPIHPLSLTTPAMVAGR